MSLRRITLLLIAAVVGLTLWASSPAGAVDNPDYTSPPPSTAVSTPAPAQQVKPAVTASPVRTRLAITGSDAATMAVVGAGLVVVGTGTLVLRRRSATAS